MLEQRQCLRHVLCQAVQRDAQLACADADAVVASQLVELLLQLFIRVLIGAEIVQVLLGVRVAQVGLVTEVVVEAQREASVLGVLDIDVGQLLLRLAKREVALEVDEARLDGLHVRILDVLHELAHQVAVGRNRCDLRLVNLLQRLVLALTLQHRHVVLTEVAASEVDHLLLGDAGDAVEIAHLLLPGNLVDVGLNEQACTVSVALE